jgi:hypothetical protein
MRPIVAAAMRQKLDRRSPPVACMPLEFTFDAGGTIVSVDPLASEAQS